MGCLTLLCNATQMYLFSPLNISTAKSESNKLRSEWEGFTINIYRYRVRQNKVAPSIFCGFLSNRLEFQREILRTYLVIICAFNSHVSI